ncbi:MAG: dihydrodipicolinate synthase family protein [Solirubrobacteraceae bacterium]
MGSRPRTADASREVGRRLPWLSGVVPPVCTPLNDDQTVDVDSLERLIGFLLGAGVHGLFVLGSSGEMAFLRDEQREMVIDVTVRTVAGQVPVLVGAIDMSTPRVIDHAARAVKIGADAVVVTAPFYARATHPVEITRHFQAVKAATGARIVAYDIPAAVHTKLDPYQLADLATAGTIDGVKDSSGDLYALRQLVMNAPSTSDLFVFTGSEVIVDGALLAGADGAVPGLGNVDPHGYVELYEAARVEDWAGARSMQEHLIRLFAVTTSANRSRKGPSASEIGAFKTALLLRGVIATNAVALPQERLDEDETARVRAILVESGLL